MKHDLKSDVARNERIVAYIHKQYPGTSLYDMPNPVYTFVTHLQRDIDKAKGYMSSGAKR